MNRLNFGEARATWIHATTTAATTPGARTVRLAAAQGDWLRPTRGTECRRRLTIRRRCPCLATHCAQDHRRLIQPHCRGPQNVAATNLVTFCPPEHAWPMAPDRFTLTPRLSWVLNGYWYPQLTLLRRPKRTRYFVSRPGGGPRTERKPGSFFANSDWLDQIQDDI
jgi:hypothetical protein